MRQKHPLYTIQPFLLVFFVAIYFCGYGFAQEGDKDISKEQLPVQERDRGDSFIENLGEVPGKIITLPFSLLFTGIAKTAGFLVDHNVYLTLTDWLTNEDGTRKVRPIFTPPTGGGLTFKQENLFTHGMTFRAEGSLGTRTRRYFGGSLTDLQLFSPRFGMELVGFQHRKPDDDFFGIGNNSLEADETNYLLQESNFEIDLLATPFDNTQFFFGVSYSDVNIEEGRDPKKPSIEENMNFNERHRARFFGCGDVVSPLQILS